MAAPGTPVMLQEELPVFRAVIWDKEIFLIFPYGGSGASGRYLRALLPRRTKIGHSVPSIRILLTMTPSITPPSTISSAMPACPLLGVLKIGSVGQDEGR